MEIWSATGPVTTSPHHEGTVPMSEPRPAQHRLDPADEISPAVVTPVLDKLRADLDAHHHAADAESAHRAATQVVHEARELLAALQLRTYAVEPGTDDRGEQVVITVYGVDLSIRRRDDGVFVHIDSTEMPDELRPLIGEFNNGGENVYAERDESLGARS